MEVAIFQSTVYVHPSYPVEFMVAVDGKTIRIAVEWRVIERLMGTSSVTEERVRDFLHRHRMQIRLALEAHLFARGVPRSGYLVMSEKDFDFVQSAAEPASKPASEKSRVPDD